MLKGEVGVRIQDIISQVCKKLGVKIIKDVLSGNRVHMVVSIPPQLSVSDVIRRMNGRSSYRVQQEYPELKKRYWGRYFWELGHFCTTSGNVTDDIILQYIQNHAELPASASSSSVASL
ncbi:MULTISPECIES: IS200/IS605 family transposase [Brucella]|uniref:IS200/IS605 family transposase n=1 Tax=Brucella TaxID=234 RepID=UPI001950B7D6